MADIKYEITESIGILSESISGWRREVNMVSWNDAKPKLDIRDWSADHSKMGKGISLNAAETIKLVRLLTQEQSEPKHDSPCAAQPKDTPKTETEQKAQVLSDDELNDQLDQIASELPYMEDICTWDAFRLPPEVDEFFSDDQRYLAFCRDAAKTVTKIKYDLSKTNYLEIRELTEKLYRELLKKYHFPEESTDSAVHEMLVRFFLGRAQVFMAIEEEEDYQGDIPELTDDDMDTVDMAYTFAVLPEQPEIKSYLKEIQVTYDYEQLHMVTWFSGQVTLGDGKYSRQVPNHSAKMTYNRLLNPYSLLWIAAALGEKKETVIQAAREAESKKTFAAKCRVVRKAIPFDNIKALAEQRFAEYSEAHPLSPEAQED